MQSISVALCTYNGARFVEEQLQSILDQTLRPTEIVVADDGSTDDTIARLRAVFEGAHDNSIELRVLPVGERLGVTANFQRAVEACRGDVIVLCDQDDVWHADRLATAVPEFASDAELLLQHSDALLVDMDGASLGHGLLEGLAVSTAERRLIADGRAVEALIRRNLVTGATTAFRKDLLSSALPFPPEWVHDEWLALIAASTGRMQLLERQLIDYRQHGSNQIGVAKPTLSYRIGRMLEPRGSRYEDLSRRSQILLSRLEDLTIAEEVLELVREKAQFEHVRAGLPRRRFSRILPVFRQWRAGSYARLSSQGSFDVVRDILQPA